MANIHRVMIDFYMSDILSSAKVVGTVQMSYKGDTQQKPLFTMCLKVKRTLSMHVMFITNGAVSVKSM